MVYQSEPLKLQVSSFEIDSWSRRPVATPELRHLNTAPTRSLSADDPLSRLPNHWVCQLLLRYEAAND